MVRQKKSLKNSKTLYSFLAPLTFYGIVIKKYLITGKNIRLWAKHSDLFLCQHFFTLNPGHLKQFLASNFVNVQGIKSEYTSHLPILEKKRNSICEKIWPTRFPYFSGNDKYHICNTVETWYKASSDMQKDRNFNVSLACYCDVQKSKAYIKNCTELFVPLLAFLPTVACHCVQYPPTLTARNSAHCEMSHMKHILATYIHDAEHVFCVSLHIRNYGRSLVHFWPLRQNKKKREKYAINLSRLKLLYRQKSCFKTKPMIS